MCRLDNKNLKEYAATSAHITEVSTKKSLMFSSGFFISVFFSQVVFYEMKLRKYLDQKCTND